MLETLITLGFMSMSLSLLLIIVLTVYTITVSIYPPVGDYLNSKVEDAFNAIKRLFNR